MTAVDMQSMHRVGAPEVSRDGRYAVFTISTTDWNKNKRINTLYLLDLTKRGAVPQALAGAEKGHDAVFGPDSALWFLMPVGATDPHQQPQTPIAPEDRVVPLFDTG